MALLPRLSILVQKWERGGGRQGVCDARTMRLGNLARRYRGRPQALRSYVGNLVRTKLN